MSRWYRAYEGTVTDAKISEAAILAGCSRSVAIATWHSILENAASLNDGGRVDIPARRVAAVLAEHLEAVEKLFEAFESIGMIGDGRVTSWKKRQWESDSSTQRVRKHREKSCNGDETAEKRFVTPPETETYTETKKESKPRATRADKPLELTAVEELQKTLDLARSRAVVEHRAKLKKPLTPHAAGLLAAKLARAPDPNSAADEMIANGWLGFKLEWLENRSSRGQGPPKRTFMDSAMDWISEGEDGKKFKDGNNNVIEFVPATGREQ